MARHLEAAGREALVVDAKAGETDLGTPDVIVDALFGTGFAGAPRPEAAALIERINGAGVPVVAIDLPSGVDASTGEIAGAAVRATATVTFHGRKVGLAVAPGRFHAGDVHVADIGLEPAETEHRLVTADILDSVPRRGSRDNKYTAGHVLVVGGSRGLTGAPCLTAMAALRADAGYVTVAAPVLDAAGLRAAAARGGEAPAARRRRRGRRRRRRRRPGAHRQGACARARPRARTRRRGAGARPPRARRGRRSPSSSTRTRSYGLEPGIWPAPRVLTPHEGELGRLLGRPSAEVAAHRLASVREAAERFGCVVLLKGADTLVAAPGSGVLVVALGLPSLATAGTGDVLTGIVAAFLAKGMEPRLAAAAAAAAQQRASVEAPQRAGLVASDLIEALPRALAATDSTPADRCTGASSPSTSARCATTPASCCTRSTARSSGRW